MRHRALIATLSLLGIFGATQLYVLGNRVFSVTTGAGGSAGGGGAAGGGAAGAAGAAAGAGGSATGGVGTGGSATGGTGTGGTGTGGAGTGGTGTGGSGTGGSATGGAGGTGGGSGACGNGSVDAFEECDASNLQNASCASLGFSGGTLGCSASCQFDVSSCAGGTITPTIVASRTSCKAPCAVFFDATSTTGLSGSDYVLANWSWDFGDPTSAQNKGTIGFNVAHVFDNPGTYTVTARVHDFAGAAGVSTSTITVSAMTGTVYYVSASGSDSASGTSTTTPFLTPAHALSVAGTGANQSILLRNGDTFTPVAAALNFDNVTGPFLFSNYSDPAAPSAVLPIINSTATPSAGQEFGEMYSASDLRITNLTFYAADGANIGFNTGSTTDLLFENVEISHIAWPNNDGFNFNMGSSTVRTFFANVYLHDFSGIAVYADRPTGFAMFNSFITRYTEPDHGIRIQGGNTESGFAGYAENSYLAQTTITPGNTSTTFDAATFRGDNDKIVSVQNYFGAGTNFAPQNDFELEHIKNVLCEGNVVNQFFNDYGGIGVTAFHAVLRNNAIFGTYQPVAVQDTSTVLPANYVDQVYVYNNTADYEPSASNPNQNYFLNAHGFTGSLTAENNIFETNGTSTATTFLNTDGMPTIAVNDYNHIYTPNATLSSPNAGSHGLISNPQFVSTAVDGTGYRLASGSPDRNSGTNTHVYNSCGPAPPRPQEAAFDRGAYEYAP